MKTAEEIFNSYRDDSKFPHLKKVVLEKSDCLEAMEDYAMQQAIAFRKWISDSEFIEDEGIWYEQPMYRHETLGMTIATSDEQLFNLFTTTQLKDK